MFIMKKTKRILFFLILVLYTYSCTTEKKGELKTYELSKAVFSQSPQSDFTPLVEILDYVKLSNDTLLGNINKYWVDSDGDIIVNASNGFFRFDSKGKYLNFIGVPGKGPNEYASGFGFNAVYSDGRLFTESMNRKMNGYTKQGDFIREAEVPFSEGRMANNFITDRTAFFDGGFLCYSYEEKQPKRLMIFDKDFNLVKKYPEGEWVSTPTTGSRIGGAYFSQFNNVINFYEHGNDTVYQVTMENLIPNYVLKSDQILTNSDDRFNVMGIFETEYYIWVFVWRHNPAYNALITFDKETGDSESYDLNNSNPVDKMLLSRDRVYNDVFYAMPDAMTCMEAQNEETCPEIIKNIDFAENDNPVLLKLKFRD